MALILFWYSFMPHLLGAKRNHVIAAPISQYKNYSGFSLV